MTLNDENSVYVGGLAYEATEEQVRKAFNEFGEVVAVKIVEGSYGQPRGYGFVTYSTPEAASDAIYGMNGKTIAGRSIKVNGVKYRSGDRSMTRESPSHRERDKDRGDRDGRMIRDRDRDRTRDRYSPPRRSKRSPDRSSVRDRSPVHKRRRNDGSGTRSASPNSFNQRDRRDKVDKSKAPKGNDSKLKENLAKAVESQHGRRDEVAMLQADLDCAHKSIEDLSNREKKLEATLAKASAAFKERAEFFKKVQLAFLEVRECQNKLKAAEAEFQELILGMALQAPGEEDIAFTLANGDIDHSEETRKVSPS